MRFETILLTLVVLAAGVTSSPVLNTDLSPLEGVFLGSEITFVSLLWYLDMH